MGRGLDVHDALALTPCCHFVVTDHPAETAGRDQHQPHPVVDNELQRLRYAVVGDLTDRGKAERLLVEPERGLAIGYRRLMITDESDIDESPSIGR